jgi:hypothetical protein
VTFRTRHDFVDGATLLGAQLAHCGHCGTLRVTDTARHPQPRYIIRTNDELRRDTFEAPPCIEPIVSKGAKERVDAMNRARARDQAARAAINAAPPEAPAEPVQASLMLPNFPWYSDLQR